MRMQRLRHGVMILDYTITYHEAEQDPVEPERAIMELFKDTEADTEHPNDRAKGKAPLGETRDDEPVGKASVNEEESESDTY